MKFWLIWIFFRVKLMLCKFCLFYIEYFYGRDYKIINIICFVNFVFGKLESENLM